MHEMAIATSVLEAAESEVLRHPGARLIKVGVRIGEWSGVEPESLRFCFECLVAGEEPSPPALEIEVCPRHNRCPACGGEFRVENYNTSCPACGNIDTRAVCGDELELAFLELEEA